MISGGLFYLPSNKNFEIKSVVAEVDCLRTVSHCPPLLLKLLQMLLQLSLNAMRPLWSMSITHAFLSTAAGLAFKLAIAGSAAFAVEVSYNT